MSMPDEIQRLDGRIDQIVREHSTTRERTVKLETESAAHATQLGKVSELEKGMVKLNTQFGEFRDGVREDLTALRDGQDTLLEKLDADRTARAVEKKEDAQRRDEERKEFDAARKERNAAKDAARDRVWGRLLGALGVLAVIIGALITVYIHVG